MQRQYSYGINLIKELVGKVLPCVGIQLGKYLEMSKAMPDIVLGIQAASSIRHKSFHAQGGCVYALYPGTHFESTVKFIVAFQTISDYLDNLCDRVAILDEKALLQLHLSMLHAVDPDAPTSDYYLFYPHRNDGGYLTELVEECRRQVSCLPSYGKVINILKKYIGLYSELQAFKHLQPDIREKRLKDWTSSHADQCHGISCWEFCAATGSTLGMFLLFCLASSPMLESDEVLEAEKAYFPWICGLHILLDYYIDSLEDKEMGDLNFTHFYENTEQCEERLIFFLKRSLDACKDLPYPEFHSTVVKGLLAMYLSDPKARSPHNRSTTRSLLKCSGMDVRLYTAICRVLRMLGKI